MLTDRCEILTFADEEGWHQIRASGIGGSDLHAILGFNEYRSRYSLWMQKSGLIEGDDAGEAAKWGHRLEPVVAAEVALLENLAMVEWQVTLRSKEHPFALANVDRFLVEPSEQFPAGQVTLWEGTEPPPGLYGIYEGKTASVYKADEWAGDSIPEGYFLQGQWYMGITGLTTVVYGVLIGGNELQVRWREAEPELFADLLTVAKDFWDSIELGLEPEPDAHSATENALKKRERIPGKEHDGGTVLAELWAQYRRLDEAAKEATAVAQAAKNRVLHSIGDAEIVSANGEPLFTYKKTAGRKSIDTDRLKAEQPEIYKQYEKQGAPYPRLVPKKGAA